MTEDEFRAYVADLVEQTCGSTAALARKHNLHPKALTLFLSGTRGPSAEVARAFGFERKYVPLATPAPAVDAPTERQIALANLTAMDDDGFPDEPLPNSPNVAEQFAENAKSSVDAVPAGEGE